MGAGGPPFAVAPAPAVGGIVGTAAVAAPIAGSVRPDPGVGEARAWSGAATVPDGVPRVPSTGDPVVAGGDPSGPPPSPPADPVSGAERWPLTDHQAVELVRANAVATNAGFAFYAVDDEIRHFAQAVRPTDGFVTLDLHGNATGFMVDGSLISPEQFAAALSALRDNGRLILPDGASVKLLSCETAAGGAGSPAARLARALGVVVVAPDQPVWTTLGGDEIVASGVLANGVWRPAIPPDGDWHVFDPSRSGSIVDQNDGADRPDAHRPDAAPRGPDAGEAARPRGPDHGDPAPGVDPASDGDPVGYPTPDGDEPSDGHAASHGDGPGPDAGGEPGATPDRIVGVGPDARLLGAGSAVIDERKLLDYALDPDHPVGGAKARVFLAALGVDRSRAAEVTAQIRAGVLAHPPQPGREDPYGARFTVDIPMSGPAGTAVVRTGWIYDPEATVPRLVTLFVR
jgi:hypothetical protein